MKTLGARPVFPDHRDRDWHSTFGSVSVTSLPESYNANFTDDFPDQNVEGFPEGCVRYTTRELCNNLDKCAYDLQSVFHNMALMGIPVSAPADIRDGLNSVILFGIGKTGETPAEWLNHKNGAYYRVEMADGMDYFDSTRTAMVKYTQLFGKPCSVSVGSQWFANFNQNTPVLTQPTKGTPFSEHNYEIGKWDTENQVPLFLAKTWQGSTYGYRKMTREVYNQLLSDSFSATYVLAPFTGDYSTIKLDYLEYMIGLLNRLGVSGDALISFTRLIQKAAATLK